MIIGMMFAMIVFFTVIGIPIAFSLGLTTFATLLYLGNVGLLLGTLADSAFGTTASFTLLAIPFFILAGSLMNSAGVTESIFRFANSVFGWLHGGLGHVAVVTECIVSGISGSAIADAAGVGKVFIKSMTDEGFDKPFCAALVSASSTLGPIIPPSIGFVVYGAITGLSVGKLFIAGIMPGLVMGLFLMICIYILSVRRGYPRRNVAPLKELVIAFINALPALGAPVIIIGGIIGGIFTPTEASVIAVAYCLILGVLYGKIKLSNIIPILYESFIQTVQVMYIIAIAAMFGWLLTYLKGPQLLVGFFTSVSSNYTIIILMIVSLVFILGCFVEGMVIILTVGPSLAAVAMQIGMDPIHFGVIFMFAISLGLVSPPVGLSVYTVSAIAEIPAEIVFKEGILFFIALSILLLLIIFWPPLTLWLLNFFNV